MAKCFKCRKDNEVLYEVHGAKLCTACKVIIRGSSRQCKLCGHYFDIAREQGISYRETDICNGCLDHLRDACLIKYSRRVNKAIKQQIEFEKLLEQRESMNPIPTS